MEKLALERQKKMEKVRQSLRFSAPGEAMRQEFTTTTRERKARAKRSMGKNLDFYTYFSLYF